MKNTITLQPYSAIHFEDLMSYELDEEQRHFTALPKENLVTRNVLADPEKHAVTILLQGKAIGFFVLDAGQDREQLSDNPRALLLRSLSVNPIYQGQGFGQQAMTACSNYVPEHLPAFNEIVLLVNLGNEVAYHMYLKAGFTDTGKEQDGRSGRQHLMVKLVPDAQ
jgi:ribosomal protein S18 acetylase RimI-like enzyme